MTYLHPSTRADNDICSVKESGTHTELASEVVSELPNATLAGSVVLDYVLRENLHRRLDNGSLGVFLILERHECSSISRIPDFERNPVVEVGLHDSIFPLVMVL